MSPTRRWWPTTWGALLPGDVVQAPTDGSPWHVIAAVVHDGGTEYCIRPPGRERSQWILMANDVPVMADRPDFGGSDSHERVVGVLLEAGLTVTPVY